MDLRQIRYFVVVAEELHFTRAAARLGIGQPPLSQAIRRLEEELNVQLFDRGTRRVQLTEAGAAFLHSARALLSLTEEARLAMQQFGRGERGSIRLGLTSSASFHPFVTREIGRFRAKYPDVEVLLTERTTSGLIPRLRDGTIDAAFIRPAGGDTDGLCEHFLLYEEMLIALPVAHRLAGRPRIALRALAREPFVMCPRSHGRSVYDAIIASCQNAGFSPRVIQEAPQASSTINLVAAGIGVAIVSEAMTQLQALGVAYRPIAGAAPRAGLSLVTGQRVSKAVDLFVQQVVLNSKRDPALIDARRRRGRAPP